MADLKISELNALAGGNLVAADELAIVDDSASETKRITVTDLVGNATTLIADATIPGAKILFSAGGIAGASIADGGISTAKVADDAITAAKLGNESTVDLVTTLPGTGAFTGQIALDTDDNKIYIWDGSAWQSVKGAGSVNAVNGSAAGIVNTATSTSGDTVTITTSLDNTTAAAQFLGGPTGAAGTVGYRALVGTDIPTPTTNTKGAVIVNGEGLRMDGDTIEVDNDVTANSSTYQAVQFDSKGLITAGRDITAADLPAATSGAVGAVKPGTGLTMGAAGALNHTNALAASTAAKISYDAQGHVTAGTTLDLTDIPDIPASKITSGTFGSGFLAENSVTATQLADYGIAKISSSQPTPEFAGQLWVNPTDRTAYVWVGQVEPPEGYYLPLNNEFGAQANLRFGGTYNASTNTVASLNSYGAEAGLTVASALIAPTAASSGIYLLVTATGTGTSPAPAVSLDVGDWILSPGVGTTWSHINLVGAGITVIDATDVTFDGSALTPVMSGVADASAAITTLWGRSQIATLAAVGVVLESTEVTVDNSTGAMAVGVVDEGSY